MAEEPKIDSKCEKLINSINTWNTDFYKYETRIPSELDLSKTLIVQGIPKINKKKLEKLTSSIKKKYKKYGKIKPNGIEIHFSENEEKSSGLAMINFESNSDAISALNLKKFDAKHNFVSVLASDYVNLDSSLQFIENKINEIKKKELNMFSHCLDDRQRTQFLVREGNSVKIFWNDCLKGSLGNKDPFVHFSNEKERNKLIIEKNHISKNNVIWSPSGAFLAAQKDKKQLNVYGKSPLNTLFDLNYKLNHFEFSPKENYIVTKNDNSLTIWNFLNLSALIVLKKGIDYSSKKRLVFKWSFDEKYFATNSNKENSLKVYETSTMSLLNKKDITSKGIKKFSWSPVQNVLSITSADPDQNNYKIYFLEVPSLKISLFRSYHNVNRTIMLSWGGKRLASVNREFKKKLQKDIFVDFFECVGNSVIEIGRLNALKLAKDMVVKDKKNIVKNHEIFLVEHSISPNSKYFVSIFSYNRSYTLFVFELDSGEIKKPVFSSKMSAKKVFWHPESNKFAAVGLSSENDPCNGQIVFVDCEEMLEINRTSHFNCNWAGWSPCGRYFSTAILTQVICNNRTASYFVNIYNSIGDTLFTHSFNSLNQFSWRPAPKLLEEKEIEKISSKLNELKIKFTKSDNHVKEQNLSKEMKHRKAKLNDYRNVINYLKVLDEEKNEKIEELRKDIILQAENELIKTEVKIKKIIEESKVKI